MEMSHRAPTLCLLCLRCRTGELHRASSCHAHSTTWNCEFVNMCADSHEILQSSIFSVFDHNFVVASKDVCAQLVQNCCTIDLQF